MVIIAGLDLLTSNKDALLGNGRVPKENEITISQLVQLQRFIVKASVGHALQETTIGWDKRGISSTIKKAETHLMHGTHSHVHVPSAPPRPRSPNHPHDIPHRPFSGAMQMMESEIGWHLQQIQR
jgi:hypothetical protein